MWLIVNKISNRLARSKQTSPEWIQTNLLLFTPINKLNLALSNIKFNEYLVTLAKSVTYLGVEIDETLSLSNKTEIHAKKKKKTEFFPNLDIKFQQKIWLQFTADVFHIIYG